MTKLSLTSTLHLIVLIFLCTPSYSLIFKVSGIYVQNEKIAFIICSLLLLHKEIFRIPKSLIRLTSATLFISTSLLTLLVLRYYLSGITPSIINFNYMISFVEVLVFCIFFLRHGLSQFLRSLVPVIYLQLACATIQVLSIISGNLNITTVFSNHYAKTEYEIPLSFISLPRPFGLFNEASELSAFLAICTIFLYVLRYSKVDKYYLPSKVLSLTIIMCFAGIIFTFSLTGFLMLSAGFLFIAISKSLDKRFIFKINIGSLSTFLAVLFSTVYLYEPLTKLLFSSFATSARSSLTYANLNEIFYNYEDLKLLLGSSAVWDNATWDILTRTIQVYGVIGFSIVSIYLLIVATPFNIFSLIYLAFLLSNASPASSVFIFTSTTIVLVPLWLKSITKSKISY